jgi:glyoxylase-like metal-dependent hydrolase (beta-lactamase superfamily II)
VVIGEDAVLVVDSGQFPSLARRMVADVKKLTGKPVRYLVKYALASGPFLGQRDLPRGVPDVAILSTEYTRELLETESPKYIAASAATNRKEVVRLREMLAAGKLPDGRLLTDDMRRMLTRSADTLEHIEPDLAQTVNAPPTIGFEKELTIDLGNRVVKVMWLGRANTGGDAVTWIPDVKVLVTGDAVVYPTPFAFGSYMGEWPATLQKMVAMNAAAYVPGHGPVLRDAGYLKTLIERFQALTSQVREAVSRKQSLEETRKLVKLEDFGQRLAGDDSMRKAAFRSAFLHPAVDRAYQEATGRLKPEAED